MEIIKKYRIINTIVTVTGVLLCIVSGFIPAPLGILTEGRASIIQALPGNQKLVLFVLPAILFIAAAIIVASGRYRLISLITVLAGSCLFSWMDLTYIQSSQSFAGTLINEAGIVIAVSGVFLHAFGMPKYKAKARAAEIVSETPAPIEEDFLFGRQEGFYDGTDNAVNTISVGRNTMELQDTLVAALKTITKSDGESASPLDEKGLISEKEVSEEPHTANPGRTKWASDSELAEILRTGIKDSVKGKGLAEGYRFKERNNEKESAKEESGKESITDFYAGLEDIFKSAE